MTQDFNIAGATTREMLAFLIGRQEFCVDVLCVREIRGWTPAIALPHAHDYMRGVVNLRGAVLPIIDLGARLGFPKIEPTDRHVIIVSEIGPHVVGLLVDAVTGLLNVSRDNVQPAPDMATDTTKGHVEDLLAIDGRMISLLSLRQIISDGQLDQAA